MLHKKRQKNKVNKKRVVLNVLKQLGKMHDKCNYIGKQLLDAGIGIEEVPDEGDPVGSFSLSNIYCAIDEVEVALERHLYE